MSGGAHSAIWRSLEYGVAIGKVNRGESWRCIGENL